MKETNRKNKADQLAKAKKQFDTALGYAEVEVRLKAESGKLAAETVKVYQTRARDIGKYHLLLLGDDIEKFAEFLCRKDPGWAESLDPKSVVEILDTGQEINRDFHGAWFRWTMKRNEALMPGTTDIVAKMLDAMVKTAKDGKSSALAGSLSSSG